LHRKLLRDAGLDGPPAPLAGYVDIDAGADDEREREQHHQPRDENVLQTLFRRLIRCSDTVHRDTPPVSG